MNLAEKYRLISDKVNGPFNPGEIFEKIEPMIYECANTGRYKLEIKSSCVKKFGHFLILLDYIKTLGFKVIEEEKVISEESREYKYIIDWS